MKILYTVLFSVFLAGAGLLSAASSGVPLGILRYGGGDWYSCIPSVNGFLENVGKRLGFKTRLIREGIRPGDPGFYQIPLYFLNGHGRVLFTVRERIALKRYLENGGFLFVNDDYGMDKSFRRLLKMLFPANRLVRIPANHPLYSIWFRLPHGLPKIHKHNSKPPAGYGLFLNGRMVLFYAYESDIMDGWDAPEIHKDPPAVRESAFRVGFNILYYALTR